MMREEVSQGITYAIAGIIIAFLAIGAYFGYDALTQAASKVFAAEGMLRQRLISYAVSLALAVVAAVLLLGLWNMVSGRSEMLAKPLCAGASCCNSSHFV